MNSQLIVFFYFVIGCSSSPAQSAVYVCSSTGKYSYFYGTVNAADCAYSKCISNGAISPYLMIKVSHKGYGAIALGYSTNGRRIIGAAAGCRSRADAHRQALVKCSQLGGGRPTVRKSWNDAKTD